mmetsp:Transcript_165678/g.531901  ORF Transcript_165678/g.531901 Transcript_165678/m.531901 type:complete len:287 (-) Transcript_165678:13-873(-)
MLLRLPGQLLQDVGRVAGAHRGREGPPTAVGSLLAEAATRRLLINHHLNRCELARRRVREPASATFLRAERCVAGRQPRQIRPRRHRAVALGRLVEFLRQLLVQGLQLGPLLDHGCTSSVVSALERVGSRLAEEVLARRAIVSALEQVGPQLAEEQADRVELEVELLLVFPFPMSRMLLQQPTLRAHHIVEVGPPPRLISRLIDRSPRMLRGIWMPVLRSTVCGAKELLLLGSGRATAETRAGSGHPGGLHRNGVAPGRAPREGTLAGGSCAPGALCGARCAEGSL